MKKLELSQDKYDGVVLEIQDDLPLPEEIEFRFFVPMKTTALRYVLTQEGVKNNEYYERYIYRPAEATSPVTGDKPNSIIDLLKQMQPPRE